MIEDGHLNLPQAFVWVCEGQHTHVINPKGKKVWIWVCCLMTPGLSKDIRCRMTILFLNMQIARLDTRPNVKCAVSLVIEDDHLNLPQALGICVGM